MRANRGLSVLLLSLLLSSSCHLSKGEDVEIDDEFDMAEDDYFDEEDIIEEGMLGKAAESFGNIQPGQVSLFVQYCTS